MNTTTALDVMVKMGAFEKMPKQGSITAKELGSAINLEPGIVGTYSLHAPKPSSNKKSTTVRLMRMLTGTGIIALVAEDTYAHTPKSMTYLEGAAVDFFNLWYELLLLNFKEGNL